MVNGGNDMAKGLGNISTMMKQAQKLQKQMVEIQEALAGAWSQ